MLRLSVFFAVLLAAGAVYCIFFWPQGPSEEPKPVQRQVIKRSAHGSGQIQGYGVPVKMKFPFAGLIDDILVKEGDWVKLGEVIAKLNTTEIDDKIKLEELTLKELTAKRDALSSRKSADLLEKARVELKAAEAFVVELETLKLKLLTQYGQRERQDE